jgi:hypothetical protein
MAGIKQECLAAFIAGKPKELKFCFALYITTYFISFTVFQPE